jgi:hypothetical protein
LRSQAIAVCAVLAARSLIAAPAFAQDNAPESERPTSTTGAVVLELFTSLGCSSCPPADRLLSRLGLDEPTRARVVPLEFHVDYWNQGGWSDPFSAPQWSERQEAYVHALAADGAYTPQLVVGGGAEFPGGNEQRARAAIDAELGRALPGRISLARREARGPALTVTATAELAESVPARKVDLLVALFENGLVTPVAGGENLGKTLRNDFVVRRLARPFSLEPKAGARRAETVALEVRPGWRSDNLGVAAFLQDPASMRIFGAAVLPPSAGQP